MAGRLLILFVILSAAACAANTLITHTGGNDSYGGGYTGNYAGTWSGWHSSFGPIDTAAAASISDNGSSKVRITKAGAFDGAAVGLLVYCDFSATYTDGRYEIIAVDASDNYIDIELAYSSDVPTVGCSVGGALLTVKGMVDLLVTGDTGYIVESATDYDIGTAITVTDGRTISLYGVKASDGSLWYTECGWNRPTLLASAEIVMLTFSTAAANFMMNGIEMDGGGTGNATGCINCDGGFYFYCDVLNCKIGNATGKQIEGSTSANMTGRIKSCEIYGGTYGIYGSSTRSIPMTTSSIVHTCSSAGIYYHYSAAATMPSISNCLVYNCGAGIYFQRYGQTIYSLVSDCVFDNTLDLAFEYAGTANTGVTVTNSLFYGTTAFDPDNENDTVGFVAVGCLFRSGITKTLAGATGYVTQIGSRDLTGDPFVDSANDDYRLDPTSADFAKVYDWTSGKSIGPYGPAPAPTFPAEADVLSTADPYGWGGEYEGTSAGGSGGVIQGQGLHSIESGV